MVLKPRRSADSRQLSTSETRHSRTKLTHIVTIGTPTMLDDNSSRQTADRNLQSFAGNVRRLLFLYLTRQLHRLAAIGNPAAEHLVDVDSQLRRYRFRNIE